MLADRLGGSLDKSPVGFDESEPGQTPSRAEVSLYLDPSLHGLGLGPHLLCAGEGAVGHATIDATVLVGNRPSQRLFAACGYERVAPDAWIKRRD